LPVANCHYSINFDLNVVMLVGQQLLAMIEEALPVVVVVPVAAAV
jgi:hypothetical protein